MSSAHEARPKARARKQVVFQDFDVLKARKQQLKNDLKEMNKAVKMQLYLCIYVSMYLCIYVSMYLLHLYIDAM